MSTNTYIACIINITIAVTVVLGHRLAIAAAVLHTIILHYTNVIILFKSILEDIIYTIQWPHCEREWVLRVRSIRITALHMDTPFSEAMKAWQGARCKG